MADSNNWLVEWRPIEFVSDPSDQNKIRDLKRKVRIYVRGWLAEHNAEKSTNFFVEDFDFQKRSNGNEVPLKYDVYAFLNLGHDHNGSNGNHGEGEPGERPGGEHLIPPPPPPPPDRVD